MIFGSRAVQEKLVNCVLVTEIYHL
jgi:hypothetical protein